MRIIVTGGAGFIGSHLSKYLINVLNATVLVIDKLTYAGHLENLESISKHQNFKFSSEDILNKDRMIKIFNSFKPDAVFHLAAESHVDRSIDNPENFMLTNTLGSYLIAEYCLKYCKENKKDKTNFKLIYLSTDEVYGSLNASGIFNENSNYQPTSPYAASKACGDLIIQSYYKTYKLPAIIAHCSNNYGPYQLPEKLIPLCIYNAISNQQIPVYGTGTQIRDWIHVLDHVNALACILKHGIVGENYCIGANQEISNLDIVHFICKMLDELLPKPDKKYAELITHVQDRLAHDQHYAVDAKKIQALGWAPSIPFNQGLQNTIQWYLENSQWADKIKVKKHFNKRLGLKRVS